MGIDNNGVLVVGLEDNEFPYEAIPDLEDYDDSIGEWYWDNQDKLDLPDDMEIQDIRNDHWRHCICGIVVADSGSYDYKEVQEIEDRIASAKEAFKRLFGVEPKVFILNQLW